MKINGEEVTWVNITRKQLKFMLVENDMSNSAIAKSFGISTSKVQYKRKKFHLLEADILFDKLAKGEYREQIDHLNERAKQWLLNPENIDVISKSITNYIFRSGPVENIHTSQKPITDQDIKEINIYMVNHIAGLLTCMIDGNWTKLQLMVDFFNKGMSEWEPARPELEKIDKVISLSLYRIAK